ncbi:MAG: universal stress protein [Acidobacteriota bacterium]|nr:universal stress protein [Acidobacteriota bacterium]
MTKVKKILYATDFSGTSRKAMELACDMRDRYGAELDVVHVYDPDAFEMPLPYGMMPGAAEWIDEHFARMEDRGRQALADVLPDIGACTSHFLKGRPGPVIVHYAHDNEIDLIVMGTHGYKGFQRLLMGSVAEYILRHADCPVITVKDNPESK